MTIPGTAMPVQPARAVGIAGNDTALPMGLAMAGATWCAGLCYIMLARPERTVAAQSSTTYKAR